MWFFLTIFSFLVVTAPVMAVGMLLQKPYPYDYRKPANSEEILMERLERSLGLLKEKGIKLKDIAMGFFDESSPQNTANTVRVWSFDKVEIKKNTSRLKANQAGFYAIQGFSTIVHLEKSKDVNICQALEDIKLANEHFKAIVVVLDNFMSHKTELVKDTAFKLGIYLVYLPKYSPKLNPIEYIWKSIKRIVSVLFIKDLKHLIDVIEGSFYKFICNLSFAKFWIEQFFNPLCIKFFSG